MGQFIEKFEAALVEEIPFDELVNNIYIPAYSKHFTVSEIKAVIAFYESQVGQKFVSVTPTLMQESMAIFNQKYNTKIIEMSRRISNEEFARIKPEIEKLKGTNDETR